MKKMITFGLLYSAVSYSAIFSPPVDCVRQQNSAACGLRNETNKVLRCDLLMVGETKKGELLTKNKIRIIQPSESENLAIITSSGDDQLLHASAEAHCTTL